MTIFLFLIIAALYGSINYFIAIQLATAWPKFASVIYVFVALFALASLATLAVRNSSVGSFIGKIGSYWLAVLFISFVIFAVVKIVPFNIFYVALAIIIALLGYGITHAFTIKHVTYDIKLTSTTQIEHAVVISDVHLGYVVDAKHFAKIVAKVNALQPDVIFIVGDLFDSNFNALQNKNKVRELLNSLQAPYGTYLVWGNHDAGKTFNAMRNFVNSTNVTLLEDQAVIAGGLQIVGRKDSRPIGYQGNQRTDSITYDKSLPTVVLDHQPSVLNDYKDVDLVLSGHTHQGQIYPFRYITQKMFAVDYGYATLDSGVQAVVSSGVGFWGPPLRIGTNSEIVSLYFK